MKTIAVIGANFGDEGKGRIVDQIASISKKPVIVIRYNGGAQAGHTVIADKQKHVFNHFGSGTLAGASTYLSEYFIANPFLYAIELKTLDKPVVFYHPYMPLSTPYDMLINREVEKWRGNNKHGSCGYGIAETVERLCNTPYKTFISDAIKNRKKFKEIIASIYEKYIPKRLAYLGIKKPSDWFMESIHCNGLLAQYYAELDILIKSGNEKRENILMEHESIIFEGSQGLCLDERHRLFPHVTRSKTGLSNVSAMCRKLSIKNIEVIYVTRAYLTRHGAGPLPTEDSDLFYDDDTNIENEWQGKLRFGCLDIDLLSESINNDMKNCPINISPVIAITCFDQVSENMKIKCAQQIKEIKKDALPKLISSITGIKKILISRTKHRT